MKKTYITIAALTSAFSLNMGLTSHAQTATNKPVASNTQVQKAPASNSAKPNSGTVQKRKRADRATVFARIDKDKSGSITKEEFLATPLSKKAPEKASEKFKKLDQNGNGSISLEEFKNPPKQPKQPKQPTAEKSSN